MLALSPCAACTEFGECDVRCEPYRAAETKRDERLVNLFGNAPRTASPRTPTSVRSRFPVAVDLASLYDAFYATVPPFSPPEGEPEDTPLAYLLFALRSDLEDPALQVEDFLLAPADLDALEAAHERHLREHNPGITDAELKATLVWWRGGSAPMEVSQGEAPPPSGFAYVRAPENRSEARFERDCAPVPEEQIVRQRARYEAEIRCLRTAQDALSRASRSEEVTADNRTPETITSLAYLASAQAYYAKRSDGTWNLDAPMRREGADKYLQHVGIDPRDCAGYLKDIRRHVYAVAVDFCPDEPATFEGLDGTTLNTWSPSSIIPVPREFPVIREVIRFLTAASGEGAEEWLLNYLAHAYQNLATRMRTAVVVYGAQRTGKSLLARVMSEVLGRRNCATINGDDLDSRFNSNYITKAFVHASEIETSQRDKATAKLKVLTGENEQQCEAKNAHRFPVVGHAKLLVTSNEVLPVKVEGEFDTRWSLFRQLETPSPDYTARMDSLFDGASGWSMSGLAELQGFAHFLATYDVDARLAGTVFRSEARSEAAEACLSSVALFANAVDEAGLDGVLRDYVAEFEHSGLAYRDIRIPGHPTLTSERAFYALYVAFAKASGLQPVGLARFPAELARARPSWERLAQSGGRDRRPRGVKVTVYDLAGRSQGSLDFGGEGAGR